MHSFVLGGNVQFIPIARGYKTGRPNNYKPGGFILRIAANPPKAIADEEPRAPRGGKE